MSNKRDRISGLLGKRDAASPNSGAAKEQIITGIQQPVYTEDQKPVQPKKKATFDMDPTLHTRLKIYAANQGKPMVDIIEAALKEYMAKGE